MHVTRRLTLLLDTIASLNLSYLLGLHHEPSRHLQRGSCFILVHEVVSACRLIDTTLTLLDVGNLLIREHLLMHVEQLVYLHLHLSLVTTAICWRIISEAF